MPHDSADRVRREVARNGGCATDGAPNMDFGGAAGQLVNCFTPIGLDVYHLMDLTWGLGMRFLSRLLSRCWRQVRTRKTANITGTKLIAIMCCRPSRPSRYGNSTYWNDGTSSQS